MSRNNFLGGACLLSLAIFAWGVGAPPLQAQSIQVTAANPNSAAEGTTNLNVVVSGSGFKRGAVAKWFETGTTNPGDVTVNSTAFNSSSQLTANITVSTAGFTGTYDIVVRNTDGRSGKGTGLFAVTSSGGNDAGSDCTVTNVTSVLNNTDANNQPLQIQSDGLGSYTTFSTRHGKDSVTSEITSGCFWTLDTTASTTRGVDLTLAYPYSPGSPAPFAGPQEVHGRLVTHCSASSSNNGIDVGKMSYSGQTLTCPMNLGFYAPNGTWYNLAMDPYNWSGTTQTQIMCTGASGGACNQWTILPDPAAGDNVLNPDNFDQVSAVGELILPPCVGCLGGTALGQYYVSFSVLFHQ